MFPGRSSLAWSGRMPGGYPGFSRIQIALRSEVWSGDKACPSESRDGRVYIWQGNRDARFYGGNLRYEAIDGKIAE